MEPSCLQSTLTALLAEQRSLQEQVHGLALDAGETIRAGRALLNFAGREDQAFSAVASLLDPVVQEDLAREHREFAEDLRLLEWLIQTTPESPDVLMLTVSLRTRMGQHVDRDARILARAAGLAKWS